MRAGFTWLTMGNLPTSLPVTPAYAMVARSKSPLDFNAKAGPPDQARHCRWILTPGPDHRSQACQLKPELTFRLGQSDWTSHNLYCKFASPVDDLCQGEKRIFTLQISIISYSII
jgi:hypothetical protein